MKSFDLEPGRQIAGKYQVLAKLGSGWEGEVYKIVEKATGIECAAKLFFPARNPRNRTALTYAKKLHRLRDCPIVIRYHTQERITWQGKSVSVLISDYVDGQLLSKYLRNLRGRRLAPFQALHLLHALAVGLEGIHFHGCYHGDLHTDNIMVCRVGLHYELKLLDLFNPGGSKRDNIANDISDAIRIFYDALGGNATYARQSDQIKKICCGLKRSLIAKRFRSASALRLHLEALDWH